MLKKIFKYPTVLLLFGFIAVFSLASLLTPAKGFSEMENRYLAQIPDFSFSAMLDSSSKGFAQRFETYINDQFPMRDGFISLKSRCEALLGKVENNGIVYGEDNYLFDKVISFDNERLEKNLGFLEEFALINPDVTKYLMTIPASYTVMPQRLPLGLSLINEVGEIDAVYKRMTESGYMTIDVYTALSEHSDEYIYYRTDHHWTTDGAFYGYEAFCNTAGIEAVTPSKSRENTSEGFYGTYFSKAKNYNAVADTITWFDLPTSSVTIDGEPVDGMYDYSCLESRDKYAMFLHANNGITVIENQEAELEKTLFVIKDSYANSFVPFLTQSYQRVAVIDLRSLPKGLNELIAAEKECEVLVLYSFSNLSSDANLPRIRY